MILLFNYSRCLLNTKITNKWILKVNSKFELPGSFLVLSKKIIPLFNLCALKQPLAFGDVTLGANILPQWYVVLKAKKHIYNTFLK